MQFLLEGQEEIGSPNLAELLQENAELLKADIALSADGGQISPKHVSHTTTALFSCLQPMTCHVASLISASRIVTPSTRCSCSRGIGKKPEF